MAGTLGIDPTKDAAGIIGNECFLCGHVIFVNPHWFGERGDFAPKLPCHVKCVAGKKLSYVVREYRRRLADLVNAKRMV